VFTKYCASKREKTVWWHHCWTTLLTQPTQAYVTLDIRLPLTQKRDIYVCPWLYFIYDLLPPLRASVRQERCVTSLRSLRFARYIRSRLQQLSLITDLLIESPNLLTQHTSVFPWQALTASFYSFSFYRKCSTFSSISLSKSRALPRNQWLISLLRLSHLHTSGLP